MGGQRGVEDGEGAGTQYRALMPRVGALYNGQVVCKFSPPPPKKNKK